MGGSRGAKVDPKDYEPGEREKALAAIAVDANNYYVNHLQPVMAKQLKHAASDRFAPTVKGFRQADIQQAMTGKLDLDLAIILAAPSNIAICPSWPHACIIPSFFDL